MRPTGSDPDAAQPDTPPHSKPQPSKLQSGKPAIIDLRSAESHAQQRPPGAVRLSLQDLEERAYLLPPRQRPLTVIATSTQQAEQAAGILQRAERSVRTFVDPEWRDVFEVESGPPTRAALWEASPVVQRFIADWAGEGTGRAALDVACGTGRNAVALAQRGFRVTGIDKLDDALERAHHLARHSGVMIDTVQADLEQPGALAGRRADVVVVVRYLDRRLFAALEAALVPGGMLVYETFTIEQKRLGHPRNPLYLLQPGELRGAFASLEVLFHDEDWHDGAHTAQLIARKRA